MLDDVEVGLGQLVLGEGGIEVAAGKGRLG